MAKDNSQSSSSSAADEHRDAVGEDKTGSTGIDAGTDARPRGSLIKRLGFYGFMFFLIKGLLWLIIPALMVYFGYDWGAE